MVGTFSATFCSFVFLAASIRLPINEYYWGGMRDYQLFQCMVAGSIFAGLSLYPFQRMKWQLAVILGPVLWFPISTAFGTVYDILTEVGFAVGV
jgi:hypothetical protein